jgi:hypothetical protein
MTELSPKFPVVSCSQCGNEFGAGDHGFSQCDQHDALGGIAAMREAYYAATGQNRAATIVAAYFDGIGEWQW